MNARQIRRYDGRDVRGKAVVPEEICPVNQQTSGDPFRDDDSLFGPLAVEGPQHITLQLDGTSMLPTPPTSHAMCRLSRQNPAFNNRTNYSAPTNCAGNKNTNETKYDKGYDEDDRIGPFYVPAYENEQREVEDENDGLHPSMLCASGLAGEGASICTSMTHRYLLLDDSYLSQ